MPNVSNAETAITDNTAKVTNVTTNLSATTSGTSLMVTSSDGTDASIPAATVTEWGAMTDEDKTKLDSIETDADVTDTTNVTSAGALMDSELTDLAGVKGVTVSTLQSKPSEGGFVNGDKTKLDGIDTGANRYTDASAVSAVSTADDYLKNDAADTIAGDLTVDSDFLYIKDQSGSGAGSRFTTATLTSNRTLTLPDESGTLSLTKVHHHFIHAGFFLSYPYSRYIPLNGSLNEQTTSTSAPEYTTFVWPYDGYVKTIWVRSETDMGSTELKLYKGANGSSVGTVMGSVSLSVGVNTSVEFDMTGVTNSFSQGEAMAIKIDPVEDPDGGQNVTIECIFNLTT
jgi:hypothetical protein